MNNNWYDGPYWLWDIPGVGRAVDLQQAAYRALKAYMSHPMIYGPNFDLDIPEEGGDSYIRFFRELRDNCIGIKPSE